MVPIAAARLILPLKKVARLILLVKQMRPASPNGWQARAAARQRDSIMWL